MNNQHQRIKIFDIVSIALFAVVIAVCSWITIPFTIPFTLQTFAIFLVLLVLGGKKGMITIVLYLVLGIIGIPVFSNFVGGVGVIIGPTGGYILGFIFIGLIYLVITIFSKKLVSAIIALVIGLMVCYLFGTLWFTFGYLGNDQPMSFWTASSLCVLPFIIPDLVKLTLAVLISLRIKKYLAPTNNSKKQNTDR